jgi:Putative manganese efflux pump
VLTLLLVGLLIGRGVSGRLGSSAHVLVGLLLILVGVQMAVSELRSGEEDPPRLAGAPLVRLVVLAAVGLAILTGVL